MRHSIKCLTEIQRHCPTVFTDFCISVREAEAFIFLLDEILIPLKSVVKLPLTFLSSGLPSGLTHSSVTLDNAGVYQGDFHLKPQVVQLNVTLSV